MADDEELDEILEGIRRRVRAGRVRVTQHGHTEMVDESITLDDVFEAIESDTAQILENYPTHQRGACCLLGGETEDGRPVHVVCTTENPTLIIITVYEPMPPKWLTPTKRGP